MAETSNLQLYVTPSSDVNTSLRTWVQNMAASDQNSNMQKIDSAYGSLAARIEEVAADPGMSFDELLYDESYQLHIMKDGVDVVDPVVIMGGSTEPPTGAILRLVNKTGSSSLAVASGKSCDIKFSFSSIDNIENTETGPGTFTFLLDGVILQVVELEQGEHTYTLSADLLTEGDHSFVVKVKDSYETTRQLTWRISVKTISLRVNLNNSEIFYIDQYPSGYYSFNYSPIGSGINKTTYFVLDGIEIGKEETASSNSSLPFSLPVPDHGSHRLEIWTEGFVNGVQLKSDRLIYDMLWVKDDSEIPIISIKHFVPPAQYSSGTLYYMVYDPLNMIADITRYENGEELEPQSVDRGLKEWAYSPNTAGWKTLTINCRGVEESISFEVPESKVDVEEVTNGLVWKFDPRGRSNADVNYDKWSYDNIQMTVSDGFKWSRGGWTTDDEGYPCFIVPAGCTVSFNSRIFESDWKRSGHAVKFIYKATNVANYDAHVASCMSNGVGFEINAQNATLHSMGAETTVQLCEDYYTELDWNVTSTSNFCEMITWVQGIPSQIALYLDSDSFVQTPVVPLVIGSPDCDVNIYCIREYSNSLTDDEIFSNWLMDSPSGEMMIDRFNRNQILNDDDDSLSPDKLAAAHPNLRVLKLSCPKFTAGKKYTVENCTLTHIMMADSQKHCWTATGMAHKGQGTSSDAYGNSARNLDFDFSASGFDLANGTHITHYAMTDNSIATNYYNLKVDVASSEGVNNAFLAEDYHRLNPYLRDARKLNPKVRDTMEFHPAVLFVQDLSGELFGDTQYHFYAAGNFGNSKKNFEAQGLDVNNPKECVVELKDNIYDVQRWKSDDLSGDAWGEIVEFRYPDEDVTDAAVLDAMKASFQRVLSWVVSTDSTQATNAVLPSAVTYGDNIYKIDSAAYRLDKFRYEFDNYFVSDSIMFYYVFTERHLMTDNRAKNTFWHTSDGLLWDLCFDYDNDQKFFSHCKTSSDIRRRP